MARINFEEDAGTIQITDAQVKLISKLAQMQVDTAATIEEQKQKLKELEQEYRRISEIDLPLAMSEAGMVQFTLLDGAKITVKDDIYASVSKNDQPQAWRWLEEHGFGDIIKRKVEINIPREKNNLSGKLLGLLEKAGFVDYSERESIHSQTLNALVREQMEKGVTFPAKIFKIHQGKKAVVK